MNHLEELTAEWYEFRGYFVRRNVQVGRRPKGGYECELDVVAFCPQRKHLVHVEPSMDANTWKVREARYKKKFEAGRKYIPGLFKGITIPSSIEQVALLGFASNSNVKTLAGGRVMTSAEFLAEITSEVGKLRIATAAIPEQFPLLRTIQFAYQHRQAAGWC
ncbi:MAG: hypothetical protein E6R11_04240 [Rhodocyclaceae bacterium]|nr:MAG: hypothetical protein EYC71_07580 [Gammaproteobacteria bacterium]TXG78765.1 MAG: hypothetical protein E6R11_04240 [Rhodocyclaceae bacterium]